MKRTLLAGLPVLALVASAVTARATMIMALPLPLRVATSDLVVVGKVTGFADKTVPAERFTGDKSAYQIAKVKVEETLLGKAAKEVQVAFIPTTGGPGGPRILPYRGPSLAVGQEACLFLTKHPKKDFYTLTNIHSIINKKIGDRPNPNFKKDIAEIKRCVKLLAKPKDSLKSKDADDRLTTAAMLVKRYRTQKVFRPMPKTEEVDAGESKLILEVLAKADWGKRVVGPNYQTSPQGVFQLLGLTVKDDWHQPKDFKEFPEAAKKWLKANAGRYRIKRFVEPKE
jgi:hypothetical protein